MTNNTTTPHLKPIPKKAVRSDIYKMYNDQNSDVVRQVITAAINFVNQERKVQYSIHSKKLNSYHIHYIVTELGPAPGYETMSI